MKDGGNKDDGKGGCSDAASFHPCLDPELLRSTLAHMPSFCSVSTLMFSLGQRILIVLPRQIPSLNLLKVTYKGCVLFTAFFK